MCLMLKSSRIQQRIFFREACLQLLLICSFFEVTIMKYMLKKAIQQRLILNFCCCLFITTINAQLLETESFATLDVQARLTSIPALPVTDASGTKSTLKNYLLDNQLYPGKPYLIITWYAHCGGCRKHVDKMIEKGLDEQFNIITLFIRLDSYGNQSSQSLAELIRKDKPDRNWSRVINLATIDTVAVRHIYNVESTPMYILADGAMNIHATFTSLDIDNVDVAEGLLHDMQKPTGKFKPGTRWFSLSDMPLVVNSAVATSYTHAYVEGNEVVLNSYDLDDSSRQTTRYIRGENEYLAHGRWQLFDKHGELMQEKFYDHGALAKTSRTTHPDGKTAAMFPVNGIAKTFDSEGRLTLEGPMKAGLGDGLFKLYEEGLLTAEIHVKNGLLDGTYTTYEDGRPVSVKTFKNGKLVTP